ncbi:MAG: YjjG family noncanonical pyrimidine nucleotidase [Clostridia bacterium]|nr:YjjG family noncanonical pyrimidine nucleotidase [Clostridia bacterium]
MINTKKYTTIYFDLDNTILDFTATEYNAIKQLLNMHSLPNSDDIIAKYSAINQSWWERFEKGEIEKSEIFAGRFKTFLEHYKFDGDPQKMADDYFELLAAGHDLIENADRVVRELKARGYIICITTNGVSKTQYRRIDECGLKQYFDYIIVSEDAGAQKPAIEYFDYAMAHSPEKDKFKIIVIGDSLSSDIQGGINFGVDTCWLNPKGKPTTLNPTYEIANIMQILDILH